MRSGLHEEKKDIQRVLKSRLTSLGREDTKQMLEHFQVTNTLHLVSCTLWASSETSPHGLPWWFSGKEPACQCRRHGFNPWSGKIPLTSEQLCATATGPSLQSLATAMTMSHSPFTPQQKKPPQWEARAPQLDCSPYSPKLEKSPRSNKHSPQPSINKTV